jgi:hypothetical protein
MILLESIVHNAIEPALALLPPQMDAPEARVMLLAIGLQESRFMHRFQKVVGQPYIKGPARGFWQFELGTQASRGGVWGVVLHDASRYWLAHLCESRRVPFKAEEIWGAIENDDVLAAGLARLLLFTDPKRLPAVGDVDGAWGLYAYRTWRPGRPRRETWDEFHKQACAQVTEAMA